MLLTNNAQSLIKWKKLFSYELWFQNAKEPMKSSPVGKLFTRELQKLHKDLMNYRDPREEYDLSPKQKHYAN